MNDHFVNVKVDREERPDLDKAPSPPTSSARPGRRLAAHVFLTPDDHVPFYTGTYFRRIAVTECPRSARCSRLSPTTTARTASRFGSTARGSRRASSRSRLAARTISHRCRARRSSARWSGSPRAMTASTAASAARRSFPTRRRSSYCSWRRSGSAAVDRRRPRRGRRADAHDRHALARSDGARRPLRPARRRLFRYSVDREWSIPHFEKMLYDNAALLSLYSETFAATIMPLYGRSLSRPRMGDRRHASATAASTARSTRTRSTRKASSTSGRRRSSILCCRRTRGGWKPCSASRTRTARRPRRTSSIDSGICICRSSHPPRVRRSA